MATVSETDALLELLIQLKRIVGTVPDQAKSLLTSQPQLAYSLCQLMVKMNILSAEVLQKSLSSIAGSQVPQARSTPPPPGPAPTHTPPIISNGHPPPVPGFQQYPPPPQSYNGHQQPLQSHILNPPYANAAPPPTQLPPNTLAMLSAIPDDQKNMILQILSYSPEQIGQLPPADRATFIQLRATFGVGS